MKYNYLFASCVEREIDIKITGKVKCIVEIIIITIV